MMKVQTIPVRKHRLLLEKRKCDESEPSQSSMIKKSKRIPWTDDEVEIKRVFKDAIESDNITLDVVRNGVKTHEGLSGMSPRRIYDKLKKDCHSDPGADPGYFVTGVH